MAHAGDHAPWLAITALCAVGTAASVLAGAVRRLVLLGALPRPSQGHWLLGSLRQMLHPRQHLMLAAWAKELGGIFTFRVLFTRVGALQRPPRPSDSTDCQSAQIGLTKRLSTEHAAPGFCIRISICALPLH